MAERRPDLAHKCSNRRLSTRAGDRRDYSRLAREKFRCGERQSSTRVIDLDECNACRERRWRRTLRHDCCGAGSQRLRDEIEPVRLRPCDGHEKLARLHCAAVGADAGDLERGEARVAEGIRSEEVGKLHGVADRLPSLPRIVQG